MTDVLTAVVTGQPDWDALDAHIPDRVKQALRLCFQKDPRRRGGDIAAIRLAVEGAFETAPPAARRPSVIARFRGCGLRWRWSLACCWRS